MAYTPGPPPFDPNQLPSLTSNRDGAPPKPGTRPIGPPMPPQPGGRVVPNRDAIMAARRAAMGGGGPSGPQVPIVPRSMRNLPIYGPGGTFPMPVQRLPDPGGRGGPFPTGRFDDQPSYGEPGRPWLNNLPGGSYPQMSDVQRAFLGGGGNQLMTGPAQVPDRELVRQPQPAPPPIDPNTRYRRDGTAYIRNPANRGGGGGMRRQTPDQGQNQGGGYPIDEAGQNNILDLIRQYSGDYPLDGTGQGSVGGYPIDETGQSAILDLIRQYYGGGQQFDPNDLYSQISGYYGGF